MFEIITKENKFKVIAEKQLSTPNLCNIAIITIHKKSVAPSVGTPFGLYEIIPVLLKFSEYLNRIAASS